MFIPFYFPKKGTLRVVIIGGGYSGLAALAGLREFRQDAEIILIDPGLHHIKITHLHETFRRPFSDLTVSFESLEKRFNIRHIQARVEYNEEFIQQWQDNRYITVNNEDIEFDYLLVATGAGTRDTDKNDWTFNLEDFIQGTAVKDIKQKLDGFADEERMISVVGAGATGIQFLFEIAQYIRTLPYKCRVRLVNSGDSVLTQFHPNLARYVESKISDMDIEHLKPYLYTKQTNKTLYLENKQTGENEEISSNVTLLFTGKNPIPGLYANHFGQVVINGKPQERIFTAGDGSYYRAPGSNAQTAQSALRKGKLVARNILRHCSSFTILEPYLHHDLGYVINLGPTDAVGWLGTEHNVVGGLPATVVKELIEAQYDLLLAGIDTYLI